jgi:F-type H+-transporting ATPase subunit b
MKPARLNKRRVGVVAAGAAALLIGSAALAQQPAPEAQPRPIPVQPAQGQPGQVPPSMQGAPPPGMQPGMQPRQVPGLPPGHPAFGQPPGGRQPPPGGHGRALPPGVAPQQRGAVAPPPAKRKPKLEECPGHGHMDAPHHVNWWRGMLMVNNERAQKGGFVNELLFRYHNEENPCDEKNEPPPFLASLLNFGLLAFVIYRFGKKPVGEALLKRKQTIMHEIDVAQDLLNSSQRRLREYEEKLKRIDETSAQLKADFALQSETEKKHFLAEAEERRVRMRKDAEFRIEQELKAAKAELLQAAVQGAVAAAEDLLRKSASAQDQERMSREYLSAIPAALEQGKSSATLTGGAAGGHS